MSKTGSGEAAERGLHRRSHRRGQEREEGRGAGGLVVLSSLCVSDACDGAVVSRRALNQRDSGLFPFLGISCRQFLDILSRYSIEDPSRCFGCVAETEWRMVNEVHPAMSPFFSPASYPCNAQHVRLNLPDNSHVTSTISRKADERFRNHRPDRTLPVKHDLQP